MRLHKHSADVHNLLFAKSSPFHENYLLLTFYLLLSISGWYSFQGSGQYYHIETVDVDYEDLKSPGSNTVWVRPPPALPDLRDYTRRFYLCFMMGIHKW